MTVRFPTGSIHVIPGRVVHVPGWLNNAAAAQIGPAVVSETFPFWKTQMTLLNGWPARPDPGHSMSRHGDPGVTYDYKGISKPVEPFTPSLDAVRKIIVKEMDWSPNCVVVNSYAPSSGLYPHRDARYIPQLGKNPVIAAVSFGAPRTFQFHRIDPVTNRRIKGEHPIDLVLESGDLLIMYGDCDENFHHGIPSEPHVNSIRVSLTFRKHSVF